MRFLRFQALENWLMRNVYFDTQYDRTILMIRNKETSSRGWRTILEAGEKLLSKENTLRVKL